MKIIKYVYILVLALVLNISFAFSQPKVVLDKVEINKTEAKDLDYIVISANDEIEFFYHLEIETDDKSPFRFVNVLKFKDQEYTKPTNTTSIKYSNLSEEIYYLSISALDPRNQWNAAPIDIKFKVDNREAKLIRDYAALKAENKTLKEKLKNAGENQKDNKLEDASFTNFSIFSFIIGAAVSAVVLVVLFLNKDKNTKHKRGKKKMENNQVTISKQEYDRIIVENTNLKSEIAALRSQIDALNNRSQELSSQNKDLKEKVDRLSEKKDELEELQKQKDDLFAMVIHDIKNPAGLIKSLVELLKSYDLSAVEQQEIIDDIVVTSSKIVSLSQEVTRILALESSALKLNIEDWDINMIIKDVSRRNSIASNNKSIEVLLDLPDMPFIPIDPQKVDEIIDNLVSNAIKFSPNKGKIKIASKKVGEFVEISVADNGLGLSQEDISRAFQRGVKLSNKPTGNESSSGFGLWIVKKLVEAHKGRVKITSALGKGSTFTILLPLVQEIENDE